MTTTTQTRPPNPSVVGKDETWQMIASDKVEGTAVFDRKGEKLGTVRKVMIGKRDGQVRYVVMGCGGLFGFGEDSFPLPWDGLDFDQELGGFKLKGVTKEDFERGNAPRHGRDEEPNWSNDYDQQIRLYYFRTV